MIDAARFDGWPEQDNGDKKAALDDLALELENIKGSMGEIEYNEFMLGRGGVVPDPGR